MLLVSLNINWSTTNLSKLLKLSRPITDFFRPTMHILHALLLVVLHISMVTSYRPTRVILGILKLGGVHTNVWGGEGLLLL